ncbi:MAG: hypothetical protein ABIT64_06120 [Lysobacteraceae bacterium]
MHDTQQSVSEVGTGKFLDAALIGLPDAFTSLWCLWVWVNPLALGPEAVKCVVLMMLLEFILLNATGFFSALPFMIKFGRHVRNAMLLGLCAIYLVLIAGFASQFQTVWPYFAFGWLAASKLAWITRNRRRGFNEQMWVMGAWAISMVAFLGAIGISVSESLPQFGITPDVVAMLHLPVHGEWADMPHKAVASAVFYFAAMAIFKWLYIVIRTNQPSRGDRAQGDAFAIEDV